MLAIVAFVVYVGVCAVGSTIAHRNHPWAPAPPAKEFARSGALVFGPGELVVSVADGPSGPMYRATINGSVVASFPREYEEEKSPPSALGMLLGASCNLYGMMFSNPDKSPVPIDEVTLVILMLLFFGAFWPIACVGASLHSMDQRFSHAERAWLVAGNMGNVAGCCFALWVVADRLRMQMPLRLIAGPDVTGGTVAAGEERACPSCADAMAAGEATARTRCGHVMHARCAERWERFSARCPECFTPVAWVMRTKKD